jgi:uncharacterized protein (DUF305 family)
MQRNIMPSKTLLALALIAAPALALAADNAAAVKDAMMMAHHKMMAAMDQTQPTGDADKDFVLMMMPHHQGAIDMAKVELQYGKDEKLRAMAQDIIQAQEAEIAEMKAWQAAHP